MLPEPPLSVTGLSGSTSRSSRIARSATLSYRRVTMLREASDVAIEWDRIGQSAFDRHVEALLHRMFDDTGKVIVVNGRGGDDGIDV